MLGLLERNVVRRIRCGRETFDLLGPFLCSERCPIGQRIIGHTPLRFGNLAAEVYNELLDNFEIRI